MPGTWRSTASGRRELRGKAAVRPAAPQDRRASVEAGRQSWGMHGGSAPVLALLLDRVARARVTDVVRGRTSVVFCCRTEELRERLKAGSVSVVLTECRDQAGQPTLPAVEAIRAGYPSLPVIAYVLPGRTPSSEVLAMAQAGVHELVIQGFDDVGITLRAVLESASRHCAGTRVLQALHLRVPAEVLPFVRYCLGRAAFEPSVTDAARYLGVHRKTLVYRLRQAALPPPSAMVGWCRLFLAAHLLEDPDRSVSQVALDLDFPSSAALRGMLRRYTGLRPQDVRSHGGLDEMLRLFLQGLDAPVHTGPRSSRS